MKRIEFRVTDFLDRQIEQVMLKLGLSTKSEFFRMLVLHSAKENLAPPPPRASEPEPELTHNDVSVLLMNLLLKNLVLEMGSRWQVI